MIGHGHDSIVAEIASVVKGSNLTHARTYIHRVDGPMKSMAVPSPEGIFMNRSRTIAGFDPDHALIPDGHKIGAPVKIQVSCLI